MRKRLKEQRVKKEYTQKSIALKLGISRTTYTNIENGRKNPSFSIALKIKNLLNYNNDNIFSNQEFLKETKNLETA